MANERYELNKELAQMLKGGGPAGIMAARAAAGKGLRVMLIESRGYLGGNQIGRASCRERV